MKNKIQTLLAIALLTGSAAAMVSCASAGSQTTSSITGAKPYRSDLCLVTDNDLGSMGDEQRMVYQGQELKFCCTPCIEKFKKNPAKYLQKLQS